MQQLQSRERTRLLSKYGPWAVVTGASSGIGKALSENLAAAGLNLVISARNETTLSRLAQQLKQQHSVEVKVIAADMSTPEGNQTLIQQTEDMDVGLLIASAGFGTSGEFIKILLEDELDMLRVNCGSLLTLTHHFSRRFTKNKRGGIILMASLLGFQGVPNSAHYAATKAYVQSLAEGLRIELKPHGVDVLSAAPGPVSTGFASRADMQMGMAAKSEDIAVPILKALGRKGTVLPGFLTRFLMTSLALLPRWGKVRMMGVVMGGMTKHQSS